jgi:hypothetical protein
MALMGNTDREKRIMKLWAGAGIGVITVGLLALNTSGAWGASGNNLWYTMAVAGAEILVAVAFGFTVLAQTWLRRIVCAIIFAVLLWACIENGKLAIQRSFSEIFIDTSEALRAKAEVAETEAAELDGMKVDVRANAGEDLSRVRNEIAELNLELELMTSQTRIAEAQTRLAAMGLYTGRIDGIRADLTEHAMRARGEGIRRRLAVLEEREASAGVITGVVTGQDPAAAKRLEAIRLRTQADEVDYRTFWMHLILIALEGARSFGVWAFLMVSTVRKPVADERFSDDLAPGMARWEGTADEWDEIEAALKVHRNMKTGAKKGAKTRRQGNKIEAGDAYYLDKISDFMTAHNEGQTTADIARKYGMSPGILKSTYAPYMTPEELSALFPVGAEEAEPEEAEEPTPDNTPPEPETGGEVSENPEETSDLIGGEISEIGGEVSEEPDPEPEPEEPEPKPDYPLEPYDPNRTNGAAHDDKI